MAKARAHWAKRAVVATLVAAWPGVMAAQTPLPTVIVLEMRCQSELGTTVTTLFDRGAVRLSESEPGVAPRVRVRELSAADLAGYLAQIADVDLREVPEAGKQGRGAEGAWIDHCELVLQPAGQRPRRYMWRRVDTVPLGLSNLVRIVDELPEGATDLGATRLPDGYDPQPGDILRRRDGLDFRVIITTSDGRALELHAVDQPIVVFVPLGSLASEFVELVEQRHRYP